MKKYAPSAMLAILIAMFIAVVLTSGCAGSPVHETLRYNSIHGSMARNNDNLMTLKIGMEKEAVFKQMGKPEQSEAYKWGTVWLYRTAMTSGVYGTQDSDFTPVVFDEGDKLIGWGRNFFTQQVRKYEVELKQR